MLCVNKYYQNRNIRRKRNTRWVTVLPIWTGVLLEVKGQCYIGQCHLPWLKTALTEVTVLACFNMKGVTGCPVCCTSHRGSTATLAMKTAADSSGAPRRSRSFQSTGTVYTTTPVRMGYSVTSLSVTESKTKRGRVSQLRHIYLLLTFLN